MKSARSRTFLKSLLWLTTLFVGTALGITSQRIAEIRVYTDEVVQPIERSSLFRHLKSKMAYADKAIYTTEYPSSYSHHDKQESPIPGQPLSSILIHREGYSLAYDARNRNPLWVYEHLTAENIKDKTDVSHSDFKEDEKIPLHLRATRADYRGQGLDLGHMAFPHFSDQEALNETYYLTNMCPQSPQFNRGYWDKLDKHVRDLTKDYQHVYVTTGPLYLPYNEKNGRFIKYRVIGPNDVAVPSHFFKVLLLEDKSGKKEVVAYIFPNHEIPLYTPLERFQTSIEIVEKSAGLILF